MTRSAMSFLVTALFALVLTACPGKADRKELPDGKCRAFGEQCEVAKGKLGSCVVRDDCRGDDCLVCQSQH